jgi:imidazoleglycerol-phosphate dehydratase
MATTDITTDTTVFSVNSICVNDLQPAAAGCISSGIGYLDHMIDQFNSHAQIGVSLTVVSSSQSSLSSKNVSKEDHHNRHATATHQKAVMACVAQALGEEFRRLLLLRNASSGVSTQTTATVKTGAETRTSRFCCPLDEALVACELKFNVEGDDMSSSKYPLYGTLLSYSLPPYGKYPASGRTHIGRMETAALGSSFWPILAQHSGLQLSLHKIRGDNAHHIVESSFKAFARALRNLLDGVCTTMSDSTTVGSRHHRLAQLYGPLSDNYQTSLALNRKCTATRATKETSIAVTALLNAKGSDSVIDTGIATLDRFLFTIATHADMQLSVTCRGDLWIDEHHTAEDVSIALGQVLYEALGTKAGLNRMWSAVATVGGDAAATAVEVTMDLSNRPCFVHNLALDDGSNDKVGDLSLEMFEHVMDSLVVNARMTVHIVDCSPCGGSINLDDKVQAVAVAFGQALKYCAMVDCRRAGATASSKGTLSV